MAGGSCGEPVEEGVGFQGAVASPSYGAPDWSSIEDFGENGTYVNFVEKAGRDVESRTSGVTKRVEYGEGRVVYPYTILSPVPIPFSVRFTPTTGGPLSAPLFAGFQHIRATKAMR